MKKLLLFLFFIFGLVGVGSAQDKPGLLKAGESVKFTGLYLGVNTTHNATDALWRDYSRNLVLSTGATWSYFNFSTRVGVPIYKVGGAEKRTYFELAVELKLL